MCGIIGAVAQRDIADFLVNGLRRLEYRGYDSAGLVIVDARGNVKRLRSVGKVQKLAEAVKQHELHGGTGVAHTRWATHGEPTEANAHPHISDYITVVHNGIIENHEQLRALLIQRNYHFSSETDTEVIAHLVHWEHQQGGTLREVVQRVTPQLWGAYGFVVMDNRNPSILVGTRSGSPLVIGLGLSENFIASDQLALLPVTRSFIFLEEGDLVEMQHDNIIVFDKQCNLVQRSAITCQTHYDAGDKGAYQHYMQKEIYEQPQALQKAMAGRISQGRIDLSELGSHVDLLLKKVRHVQIIACGTSFHSGMVARYWFEAFSSMPCDIEIASEFRCRQSALRPNSLIITLSQSGETADTLAALRIAKKRGYLASMTICNVVDSSLVRESDLWLMTNAGTEISVASTKSFTTQLTVLLMLVVYIGRLNGMEENVEHKIVQALQSIPSCIENVLSMSHVFELLAEDFSDKQSVLFLGRGEQYPIAMEGALKLKEISYIHAEAYAAGELKHGPLALIDDCMPVIILAPNNTLLDKLKVNIEEVRLRGGQLYVITDQDAGLISSEGVTIIALPHIEECVAPIFYIVPLQLLSYYIALIKGTDIDQPRNLAKSVTVE